MKKAIPLAIVGGAAAFAGLTYFNFRSQYPPAKSLNDKNYRVKTEKMPVYYDGKTIYGELLSPAGLEGKKPTVICAHGFGASHQSEKMRTGIAFAMSGWNAYCFDFCGGSPRSKSTGDTREMTVFTEKEDLLHVIDYVKTLQEVNSERLYLIGESQGGFVSAITAPEREADIRAMVLYYPAFVIPDDARKRHPDKSAIPDEFELMGITLSGDYSRSVYDFDVFAAIGGYKRPVLILHGDKDTLVPPEYGQRGAEAYENAEFILMPGEVHGWTGRGKREAAKKSLEFFEKNK